MNRRSARTAALLAGDVTVLLAVQPRWRFVAAGLARPATWLDTVGPDVALAALCAALLWLTALWLAVGLVAGLGARLPGAVGRYCTRVTRVVVPRVLVNLALGSAGLGLLAAPAAAHAMTAPRAVPVAASVVRDGVSGFASISPWTGVDVPSPSWPVTPSPTPVAPPTWPASSTPTQLPAPAPPTSGRTPASTPTPTPNRTPPVTPTTPSTTPSTGARVHHGDSLWLLAARRLGPHADARAIAHYWPQIYAENRGVIGADPAVIHPGQVLHLPAPTQESS